MVKVYVDADAMPRDALIVIDRVAKQYHAEVISVSSINHHYDRPNHITVDPHPQAADMAIVGLLKKEVPSIVVTQDYGLAALALGQGARAISQNGLIFSELNIDRLLFERDMHARERRQTGRSHGPKPRTAKDTLQFEQSLVKVLGEFSD
jgi:uncharacterized protein